MRAINGSTLTLASGTYHNTAGQIEADDTSTVELNGAYIEGGTVSTSGSGHIDVTSSATPDGAGLVNSGTVNVLNNTTLNLTGHITNQGDINLQSSGSTTNLLLTGDVTLDGGGTVNLSDNPLNRLYSSGGPYTLTNEDNVIHGAGQLGLNSAGLVNRGTIQADQATALTLDPQDTAGFSNEGLLKVSGSGGLTINPGTFANAGTVSVDMGRQLTRQGIYTQTAGTSQIDGTLSASGGTQLNGGVLQGIGTVEGDVSNSGGTVAPGDSVGTLHLLNDYLQGAGGSIGIELGGTTPGSGFDVLDVGGSASLGGTVAVSLLNGFTPTVGDMFIFLQAGSITSTFDAVTCAGCGSNFDVVYGSDFAALQVAAVPLPASGWLLGVAFVILASQRRRRG